MFKLIRCEFLKLKRKRWLLLAVLSAFLFPAALAVLMTSPQIAGRYDNRADVFNDYFQFVMGYGVELLLPCVIGATAAMLFFMERDHDTLKNLRAIPITSTQIVLAKIAVLFCFGILFSLTSALIAIACGGVFAEINLVVYRLFFALEMGIFITAGTLPLVVLVVFLSKTYVFSVLLCVFYSVFSLTVESSFGALPKLICYLMPIPLTTLWSAGNLVAHGAMEGAGVLEGLIPTTFQTMGILSVTALLSVLLIDEMYKKRGAE